MCNKKDKKLYKCKECKFFSSHIIDSLGWCREYKKACEPEGVICNPEFRKRGNNE